MPGNWPRRWTASIRRGRREYSHRPRDASIAEVLPVAEALIERQRWVAYELLSDHSSRLSGLEIHDVERLGEGLDGWVAVATFARCVSGPAWQQGFIVDKDIQRWARSPDRSWQRAALVSTVPLNLRAAGGHGDTPRTLEGRGLLVADHDDTSSKRVHGPCASWRSGIPRPCERFSHGMRLFWHRAWSGKFATSWKPASRTHARDTHGRGPAGSRSAQPPSAFSLLPPDAQRHR